LARADGLPANWRPAPTAAAGEESPSSRRGCRSRPAPTGGESRVFRASANTIGSPSRRFFCSNEISLRGQFPREISRSAIRQQVKSPALSGSKWHTVEQSGGATGGLPRSQFEHFSKRL
jgi:hypothetical protein